MFRSRRSWILIAVVFIAAFFVGRHYLKSDAQRIRELLPQAASYDYWEYWDFRDSGYTQAKSCPLTILVFLQDHWWSMDHRTDYPGGRESFFDLANPYRIPQNPNILQLIANLFANLTELFGLQPAPMMTVIHAENITKYVCVVDGDRATGLVKYKTVDGVDAKAEFVAVRGPDGWKIVEFYLPTTFLRTVLNEDGVWENQPRWIGFPLVGSGAVAAP